jgi:hypothetical protein
LTKPEFTRRHGTDAAVFIILGASIRITGEPISSFELFAGSRSPFSGGGGSFDSHLMVTTLNRLNWELENIIVAGAAEEMDNAITIYNYSKGYCFRGSRRKFSCL